mgnify:CR=1 FL=1
MALLQTAYKVIAPKRLPNPKGTANSPTFDPSNNQNVLSAPQYREHLEDIFTTRASSDSRDLIRNLIVQDPDASASLNAFLTLSDTNPIILVKDINGAIDRNGLKVVNALIDSLTTRYDYSKGFEYTPSLKAIAEEMRYMILAEGMVMGEPIITKEGVFNQVRLIQTNKLEWFERENGRLVPEQVPVNGGDNISLDFPHIFVAYYRQDPSKAYAYSPFVSVINTAAARQRIINDLYRIMQLTGYPRMDISIMEDVIRANAPDSIKSDPTKMATYISQTINSISGTISNLRPDQAFVHTDSLEVGMVNDKKAGMSIDIEPVIKTLNAQNQAALKTMATILGRGEAGVNTASVEARLFALQCDGLNAPVGLLMSQMLTFLLRLTGSTSKVEVTFAPAEMRSPIELEAQLNLMAARLLYDLSEGIIDDDEYHLRMYGRIRPDSSPILSGTKFYNAGTQGDVNGNGNNDSVTRSVTSKSDKAAQSNAVKK